MANRYIYRYTYRYANWQIYKKIDRWQIDTYIDKQNEFLNPLNINFLKILFSNFYRKISIDLMLGVSKKTHLS